MKVIYVYIRIVPDIFLEFATKIMVRGALSFHNICMPVITLNDGTKVLR